MPVQKFVDKVFFPEMDDLGTECIGYNLPFDYSRLSEYWVNSRNTTETVSLSNCRITRTIPISPSSIVGEVFVLPLQ